MKIPTEEDFGSRDFRDSDEIRTIGEMIVRRKLMDLDDGELLIDYRWKKKGGHSGGNAVLGKCIRLTGLTRYLSLGAHFCVWLAADHCRDNKFTDEQLEALVFHELCHIEREQPEDEDEPVVYRTVGHDTELFFAELELYGAWKQDLQRLTEVVRQLPLPMAIAAT